jgi:glycosyltransferase 2 family protein
MRRYAARLFWLGLAVALLWFSLRYVDLAEVWATLALLQPWHFVVLVAANGGMLFFWYKRWQVILAGMGYPRAVRRLGRYILAAYAVSYFTPGPHTGGEPVQAYLLYRDENVPLPTAVASVAMDRTLAFLTSFSFLLLGIFVVLRENLLPPELGGQAVGVGLLLLILPALLLLVWWRGYAPLTWLFGWGWLRRWQGGVAETEQALGAFCRTQPRALWLAALFSTISWLFLLGEYWLMAYFLGLRFTWVQGVMLLTAVRLAHLLPMPGALGTLEAAQVVALQLLGLNTAVGLSLSLLIRVRDMGLALLGVWLGATRTEVKSEK